MVETQVPYLLQQIPPCTRREREVVPLKEIFYFSKVLVEQLLSRRDNNSKSFSCLLLFHLEKRVFS